MVKNLMPAFTFLAKKYNFSIAYNTITIYPKNRNEISLSYDKSLKKIETHISAVLPLIDESFQDISPFAYIYREDSLHHFLHEDQFDRDHNHYHLRFRVKLNEVSFEQILSVFVDLKFIAHYEKFNFLTYYTAAKNWDDNTELPVYTETDEKFLSCLDVIGTKIEQLYIQTDTETETHESLVSAARTLHEGLLKEIRTFTLDKNPESYQVFKANCSDLINKVSPELQRHSGWGKLFARLETSIELLGIGYLFGATINHYKSNGVHVFFGNPADLPDDTEEDNRALKIPG